MVTYAVAPLLSILYFDEEPAGRTTSGLIARFTKWKIQIGFHVNNGIPQSIMITNCGDLINLCPRINI